MKALFPLLTLLVLTSSLGGFSLWQLKGFVFNNGMLIWNTFRAAMMQIDDDELQLNSLCLNNLDITPANLIQRMAIGQRNIYLGTKRGLYYKSLEDFRDPVSME